MALCLANSLVIHENFIPYDQLVRYKWWFENGYMSSTGKCFYIGEPTRQSLLEFELRQKQFASKNGISSYEMDYLSDPQLLKQFNVYCSEEGVVSQGALTRLASVPLFFHRNAKHAVEFSGISGRITHGDQSVYDACRYYGALIVATLQGETKEQLLDDNFYLKHIEWFNDKPLHPNIEMIAQGSYRKKGGYDDGIRGKGNIASALEAALWAFWVDRGSFMNGTLAAVNLGDSTSATAAIYGQLAGAYYGYNNLPKKWLDHVYGLRFIQCLSKWIVYEGQRWQPNKSLASIITVPTPQSQSNTTTDSSNEEKSDSNVKMSMLYYNQIFLVKNHKSRPRKFTILQAYFIRSVVSAAVNNPYSIYLFTALSCVITSRKKQEIISSKRIKKSNKEYRDGKLRIINGNRGT